MAKTSVSTSQSFRQAAARLAVAGRKLSPIPGVGARMIGEEIMTDVKASRPGHGVPVHTGFSPSTGKPTGRTGGTLRSTGRVQGPTPGKKPQVTLSFGGPAAKYALAQHERVDFKHNLGEPRYLVRGMERWQEGQSRALDALKENAEAGLRAAGVRGAQKRDSRGRFSK